MGGSCGRGQPHLDAAVAVAGLEYGLRCRCRAALDRAVAKVEARAVAGAGDGLAVDLTAAEQAAAMRAAIVQRVEVAVVPDQQNGRVARHRAGRLALLELARFDS